MKSQSCLSCESPKHTWCYYYAKAELAYQKGDWNQVIDLINEAISLKYEPEDPFEWLTFIEAQAFIGNINDAEKLSAEVFAQDKRIRAGLVSIMETGTGSKSPREARQPAHVTEVLSEFQCAR